MVEDGFGQAHGAAPPLAPGRPAQLAEQVLDIPAGGVGVHRVLLGQRLHGLAVLPPSSRVRSDQGAGGVEVPVLAAVLVQQRDP